MFLDRQIVKQLKVILIMIIARATTFSIIPKVSTLDIIIIFLDKL